MNDALALRAILSDLATLADDLGLVTLARDTRDTRIAKLDGGEFSLVVLGEFNHGKSTFVNALLGETLLPVGATPTTAVPGEIRHGKAFSARAVFESGERIEIDRDALGAWLRGSGPVSASAGDRAPAPQRVEVTVPSPFLAPRWVLVDTPGVNDLSLQRADVTHGYVPRADAIVFLLDATQVLTASEQRFLRERVLAAVRDRLVFVIAKSDLLDSDERREVEGFARAQLATLVGAPALFFVSARQALAGRVEESGLPALRRHIETVLGRDRERVLIERALTDAVRLSRFVRQSLALRRAVGRLSRPELDDRMQKARQRIDEGPRALLAATNAVDAEAAALKARVANDLADRVATLDAHLPAELDAADASDIERYLGPFVEYAFRQWLTDEADVIGSALDRLAEKVVAMASESLDAEIGALGRDLAHADPTVAVSVPFLGEASVFALGALGSTALLFVSAAAGGALLLLTPAFAALARSRAARETRTRAREWAPELVRGVAVDVGARLAQVIDGFAERLRAFLVDAGGALARVILEGLERTRAERDRAGEGESFDDHSRQLEARQKAIDERIAEVRQELAARNPQAGERNRPR